MSRVSPGFRWVWRAGLGLAPAGIFALYHAFPQLVFLNYLALVPWLLLYTDDRQPSVRSGWYVLGAVASCMALYSQMFKWGLHAGIVTCTIWSVMWWAFAPLLRRVHAAWHLPRTLSVPVVWTAVEWLRATASLAHFDLYGLGYSQAGIPALVQIADVTGVYGVSFLVAMVNGLLADAAFALRDGGWAGLLRSRRLRLAAAATGALFLAVTAYGVHRLRGVVMVDGPRTAIVQPNIRHLTRNVVGVHLTQVLMTEKQVERGGADLILWPENAIMDSIRREGVYLDDLAWLADRKQAVMMVGAMGRSATRLGRTTNAAFLVDGAGRILGQYDKQMLFPWSEYVPFEGTLGRWLPALQRLHRDVIRMAWGSVPLGDAGTGMRLFPFPWESATGGTVPFAALLCSENAYAPVPAEAARMGARFLVHLTSEGEVGGPVQQQLLWISMLRAIENRIPYVRAGNTGISCFIDPTGRLQSILKVRRQGRDATIAVAGVHTDRIRLNADVAPTLYARSRDAFGKACVAATVLLLVGGWVRRLRRPAPAIPVLSALLLAAAGCTGAPADDGARGAAALEQGRALLAEGRPGPAAEALARACEEAEACGEASELAAELYRKTADFEGGEDFFDRVLARWPQLAPQARAYRAFFLERSGRIQEGMDEYQASLALAPSPRTWSLLGSLRLRMEDPDGAIAAFQEAVRLAPHDPEAHYLLGRAYRIRGDLAASGAELETILRDDPEHALAWTNLGRVRMLQGEDAAARDALERAIHFDPRNIEARFLLCRMALRNERTPDAERLLAEILRLEQGLGRGLRDE